MKKRTLLCLLILSAMLLSLAILASCSDEDDTVKTEQSGESSAEEEVETEPEIKPELPDEINFKEKTFHVLTRDDGWKVLDIYAEEDSGDTITAAIYDRNMELYDALGVEVTEQPIHESSIVSYLYTSVASNEKIFDAVVMHPMAQFQSASQNILLDLEEDVPYLELDKPWWDAGTRKDFALHGKLFYTVSDINLMAYKSTWVSVFNKNMLQDLGYEEDYIYNLVREGKWTLDEYYNLTKGLVKDLDQDNKMTSADQYGTSYQSSGPDGFLLCAGFRYSNTDEDGYISFQPLDDRTNDILGKVMKICSVSYNSHYTAQNDKYSTEPENGRNMFTEGRSLFFTETLESIDSFRDMEDEYGIVPLPKYDEEGDYTTFIHHWAGSTISVATTAPDVEKSGIVLNYMSYLSQKLVTPVYFNRVVDGKYSRDEDSYDMLTNYIMKNRVFDIVLANRYAGLPDAVTALLNGGMPAFASTYKRSTPSVERKIAELNDAFID